MSSITCSSFVIACLAFRSASLESRKLRDWESNKLDSLASVLLSSNPAIAAHAPKTLPRNTQVRLKDFVDDELLMFEKQLAEMEGGSEQKQSEDSMKLEHDLTSYNLENDLTVADKNDLSDVADVSAVDSTKPEADDGNLEPKRTDFSDRTRPELGNTYRGCRIVDVEEDGMSVEVTPGFETWLSKKSVIDDRSRSMWEAGFRTGGFVDLKVDRRDGRRQYELLGMTPPETLNAEEAMGMWDDISMARMGL